MKTPRFLLRGFRRPSELAALALGHLERQVLEETWRRGETSVRDIFTAFDQRIAYTTVMTTLDRLYKKHLLSRRKDGRAIRDRRVVGCIHSSAADKDVAELRFDVVVDDLDRAWASVGIDSV